MNIDIKNLPNASLNGSEESSQIRTGRGEPSRSQQRTGSSAGQDTISLTDTAARMRSLENTVASMPVVDSQRVAEIKQAIVEGTYEINPERIAEKMLDMEQAWGK